MEISLEREGARQPEVISLLERVDRERADVYPPESRHLLDIDELESASVRFFVARSEGRLVGIGALRLDPDNYGEVKRMFVLPEARGRGVGTAILDRLEREARDEGLVCLRLETGIYQEEALKLYRSAGFRTRGAFGGYRSDDPLLVFMEKSLHH